MIKKSAIYLILILSVLYCAMLLRSNIKLQQERNRLRAAYYAQSDTLKQYRDNSGRLVTSYKVQALQLNEFRRTQALMLQKLDQLNIKPRRVKQSNITASVITKEITTTLRDTIYINRHDTTRGQTFAYIDPWFHVRGKIHQDTIDIKLQAYDTVYTAIFKGKRYKPWLWILSRRRTEIIQQNANPDNQIYFAKHVEIVM